MSYHLFFFAPGLLLCVFFSFMYLSPLFLLLHVILTDLFFSDEKKQEGSCIMSGVTFDLKTASFDKCSNVRIKEYETTSTFGGVIHSFNVTTNQWAGKYVFKRLKFLRSKFLSHILTLIYLALWHGWKSGYYVTFTIEFLIMKVERDVGLGVTVLSFLYAWHFPSIFILPLRFTLSFLIPYTRE